MKKLKEQLKDVSRHAPQGAHQIVAKQHDMSYTMLVKIRAGHICTVDNDDNREKRMNLIATYKRILRREIVKLENVLDKTY